MKPGLYYENETRKLKRIFYDFRKFYIVKIYNKKLFLWQRRKII